MYQIFSDNYLSSSPLLSTVCIYSYKYEDKINWSMFDKFIFVLFLQYWEVLYFSVFPVPVFSRKERSTDESENGCRKLWNN